MKALKQIYGLTYDASNFNSSLIAWYNRLIDKSYDELDLMDVSKMLRQQILPEIAYQKNIDLFLKSPYDGEYNDGSLLNNLVEYKSNLNKVGKISELTSVIDRLKCEYSSFDWANETDKALYAENIETLEKALRLCD